MWETQSKNVKDRKKTAREIESDKETEKKRAKWKERKREDTQPVASKFSSLYALVLLGANEEEVDSHGARNKPHDNLFGLS